MTAEQRFRLHRLAEKLVTLERFSPHSRERTYIRDVIQSGRVLDQLAAWRANQ